MRNNCPYCGGTDLDKVEPDLPRHPHHQTVKCAVCEKFAVRHITGLVVPLVKPLDKNADTLPRR